MKKKSIPVFMYHSVGIVNNNWHDSFLTISYKDFESQLKYFKDSGYTTIGLDDLERYMFSESSLPRKTIILTFDDGYLDNYIYAYPLMKKYGFSGIIYVNPDFVTYRPPKKRMDQVPNPDLIDSTGFLSWEEMRIMEADGVMDIQSHAMSHTWYPSSDQVVDFRHPGDPYTWMTWNDHPDKKPRLQSDDTSLFSYGRPVYKHEKSLMVKKYIPHSNIDKCLESFCKHKSVDFYERDNWRDVLYSQLDKCRLESDEQGGYESDNERKIRITEELTNSKFIIEKELNKKINHLCWPGGSGTKEGVDISLLCGYKTSTAARDLPISIRKKIRNNGDIHPGRIARISSIAYQNHKNPKMIVNLTGFGLSIKIIGFKSPKIVRQMFAFFLITYGKTVLFFNK